MDALDDIEALLLLFFALWLVVIENTKRQSKKGIEEARRKTLEKERELLQMLEDYEAEDAWLRAAKRRRVRVNERWS